MNKFVKPTLYSLFGIAVLGVGATLLFSGGNDDPAPEAKAPDSTTPTAPTTTDVVDDTEVFGADFDISEEPLDLNSKTDSGASATAPTPAPAEVEIPTGPRVVRYEIQRGDVLGKVANKFGCKLDDIYRLNDKVNAKNAHQIRVGQKILVLNAKNVRDGIEEIEPANGHGTAVVSVGGAGGGQVTPVGTDPTRPASAQDAPAAAIDPLPATPVVTKPAEAPAPDWSTARKHTLKHGDNYFDLSNRYYGAISFWRHIRDANPQWKPLDTQPGMEIIIPALKSEEVTRPALPNPPSSSSSIIPPRR